jgi:plastocyanin
MAHGEVDLKAPLLTAIVVGSLAFASVASAVPTQIQVDDDFYAPAAPAARNLSAGASFHWQTAPGAFQPHNVRQDFVLFNSGAPTRNINFSVAASAGSYEYYCTVHGTPSGGMDGVVRVRPIHNFNPAGLPFTVSWALPGTTTGNRFDVQFRVGATGPWTFWRNDTPTRSGVFGQSGQPVPVMPGRTYQFRARSQKVPSQPSGWSPIRVVNT